MFINEVVVRDIMDYGVIENMDGIRIQLKVEITKPILNILAMASIRMIMMINDDDDEQK